MTTLATALVSSSPWDAVSAAAFVGEKREAAGFPSDTRYGVDLRLTF